MQKLKIWYNKATTCFLRISLTCTRVHVGFIESSTSLQLGMKSNVDIENAWICKNMFLIIV